MSPRRLSPIGPGNLDRLAEQWRLGDRRSFCLPNADGVMVEAPLDNGVSHAEWSPDGKLIVLLFEPRLVSEPHPRVIGLVEPATGRRLALEQLSTHGLLFSQDSSLLLTACGFLPWDRDEDGEWVQLDEPVGCELNVWDTRTGRSLLRLPTRGQEFLIACHPSGRSFVTQAGTSFYLTSLEGERRLLPIGCERARFSADGRKLVAPGYKNVSVIDLETLEVEDTFEGAESFDLAPRAGLLAYHVPAAPGREGRVVVRNISSRTDVLSLDASCERVKLVGDDRVLTWGREVRLFRVQDGQPLGSPIEGVDRIIASPDERVISVKRRREVKDETLALRVETGEIVRAFPGAWTTTFTRLDEACVCDESGVRLVRLDDGAVLSTIRCGLPAPSPDSEQLLFTSSTGPNYQEPGGSSQIFASSIDVRTGKRTLLCWREAVRTARVSVGGAPARVCTASLGAELWQLDTGELTHLLLDRYGLTRAIAWSDDGLPLLFRQAAVVKLDAPMLHDAGQRPEAWRLTSSYGEQWTSMVASPDGTLVAVDNGQAVSLRGLGPGREEVLWETSGIVPLAISPDSRLLALDAGGFRLWDAATREAIVAGEEPAKACAFSADSSLVAAGSSDGEVTVWRTGGGVVHALDAGSEVAALAFSPDGQLLVGLDDEGRLLFWSMPEGELVGRIEPEVSARSEVAPTPFVGFCPEALYLVATRPDGLVVALGVPSA